MVCWVSIIVFCAAVLRVAENLPLEQDDISALKYPSAEGSDNAFSEEEKELGDALSRDKRTIGFLRQLFPGLSQSDSENQVAESQVSEVKVRKARDTAKVNNNSDQQTAATGDNDNDLDSSDSAADSEGEGSEDSPRNKRLLNFNLGGGGSGSGGGSGNFLFDIIRLVAGSGTTQEKDEAENAPLEDGSVSASVDGSVDLTGKDDGYSAGVPGPLTRLFVIANRGIANLIQDLILRLAQTSERIVNFKARLITSII